MGKLVVRLGLPFERGSVCNRLRVVVNPPARSITQRCSIASCGFAFAHECRRSSRNDHVSLSPTSAPKLHSSRRLSTSRSWRLYRRKCQAVPTSDECPMIRNFQFGRLRVRRIVLGPRARTSAAAATSSATRFAGPSFASWARWKRTYLVDGRGGGSACAWHDRRAAAGPARARRAGCPAARGTAVCRPATARTEPLGAERCLLELDTNHYSVRWRLIGADAVADTLGRLIAFKLSPGQKGDVRVAAQLLEPLPVAPCLRALPPSAPIIFVHS
jgi:hypothetical protein